MSVILKDISVEKRKNNNYSDNTAELEELSYYRDMAKKCISLFSGSHMRSRMLKDEDALSHVSENIIWGHMRWKENGGRTLKSYLNQCGIWAIKSWKTKIYESCSSRKETSLNQDFNDGDSQLYAFIADTKCPEPFDVLFNSPLKNVQKIISNDRLTDLQKKCMRKRYMEEKKLREIAADLKITKQAVNQHIKSAIKKLRKDIGIC